LTDIIRAMPDASAKLILLLSLGCAFPLAQGSYQADWVGPASASVISGERFRHEGGARSISTPAYTVDVALRIKRMN
jgi:hypothetical protein